MTCREELIADALALLHAHGFTPQIQENGKHIKLKWVDFGRRYTLVISRTPSNNQARQQSRATLRRLLRNASQNGRAR
ncbi:MAG: hypothetical protein AUI16_29755 [Alphaproteobacteria bacterium 13_2_20CM_2_64_7]|jgi:hypothetical protein|nr:MAG: hypothetical protein AUI16_29755 [Alphaproteobacteria bacterium 13_2_20CM_2_64_7]